MNEAASVRRRIRMQGCWPRITGEKKVDGATESAIFQADGLENCSNASGLTQCPVSMMFFISPSPSAPLAVSERSHL